MARIDRVTAQRFDEATFTVTVPLADLPRIRRGDTLIVRDVLGLPDADGRVTVISEDDLRRIASVLYLPEMQ